ncbi:MAG: AAA family ATPase, partial [Gemmataceae bacterium]
GKSTVLQFLDFLPALMMGNVNGWFDNRRWKPADIRSKLLRKANIFFRVSFTDEEDGTEGYWEGVYNTTTGRCSRENFHFRDEHLDIVNGKYIVSGWKAEQTQPLNPGSSTIQQDYKGSILSSLKDQFVPDILLECKKKISSIKSLELLNPEYLRLRTRKSSGTLGLGGENLSSFLAEMKSNQRRILLNELQSIYPNLESISTRSLRAGWKQLEIFEGYEAGDALLPSISTSARHINDGLLRMIAIFAQLQQDGQFLVFDEIENGMNPEIIEKLIDKLVHARQQVLVTTHSPMILNYLEDDVARKGVIYLYKTPQGHTKAIPFFHIPSLKEKLSIMGPGEVFVDTNLTQLAEEIAELGQGKV